MYKQLRKYINVIVSYQFRVLVSTGSHSSLCLQRVLTWFCIGRIERCGIAAAY